MANIRKLPKLKKTLENEFDRSEMTQEELEHYYFKNNVDKTKTHLNYKMIETTKSLQELQEERMKGVFRLNRSDVVESFSIVCTLPSDREYTKEEQEEFFQKSFEFVQQQFGQENVLQGYVHLDETTPHLHCVVLPIVECDMSKKSIHYDEKLSCKEVLTPKLFRDFHTNYQHYLDDELSFETRVVSEALEYFEGLPTKESKDIKSLKNEEKKSSFDKIRQLYVEEVDVNNKIIDEHFKVVAQMEEKQQKLIETYENQQQELTNSFDELQEKYNALYEFTSQVVDENEFVKGYLEDRELYEDLKDYQEELERKGDSFGLG